MKKSILLAMLLFIGLQAAHPQASPFSNSVFPAQIFTGATTGQPIQLNGLIAPSTIGSSFASGVITVTGSSLSSVTFSVQGSSDNGATYYPLPIAPVATPSATSTSVTATSAGLYQIPLAGLTHVRFVIATPFTATSASFVLTASPNAQISRSSSSGGAPVASVFGRTGAVVPAANDYSFSQIGGSLSAAQVAAAGTLSNPTTGNAATAAAANHTPTVCPAGQYTLGVDASFNSTGCTIPVSGATLPANAALLGSNGSGNGVAVTNPQTLAPYVNGQIPWNGGYIFGDSTRNGFVAVPYSESYLGFISNDIPGPWYNYGLSNGWGSDVAEEAWQNWNYTTLFYPVLIDYEGLINDANNLSSTGAINNAVGAVTAGVTHIAIPIASQILASAASPSGTWTVPSISRLNINAAMSGTIEQSVVNGSSLTYTLPAAAHIVYWWAGNDASVGTFTVSVNGTLQTNFCTGTTTFNSFGCNGQTLVSPFNGGFGFLAQTFAGNAGTANVVVVTVTSASSSSNIVYSVGAAPMSPASVLIGMDDLIEQAGNANGTTTAAFNTALNGVFTGLSTSGLTNIFWASSRNGVSAGSGYPAARAINTTTDYATNATCGIASPPLHANGCGYQAEVKIFESAAAAAGHPITINNSGTHSTFTLPAFLYAPQLPGTSNYANDVFINPLGTFDSSKRMPGISYFSGALNQGNLFNNLQMRIASEFCPDAINFPCLKLLTEHGADYPIAFCSNTSTGLLSTDSCSAMFATGTFGNFFKDTLHLGAIGNWRSHQPTVGTSFALSLDSQQTTTSSSNASIVYLEAGTSSYALAACKSFSTDGAANWIQFVYNDSGAAIPSLTLIPNASVGDKLNGSTSSLTLSNIPASGGLLFQCSQGTSTSSNVTVENLSGVTASAPLVSGHSTYATSTGAIASDGNSGTDGNGHQTNLSQTSQHYFAPICTATGASPAACAIDTSGLIQVSAGSTTWTVNTSSVTASSQIYYSYTTGGGSCSAGAPTNIGSLITPYTSAIIAGTSFTFTLPVAPATNPACVQFFFIN